MHWHQWVKMGGSSIIIVFDTTAESFRQMPSPVDDPAGLRKISMGLKCRVVLPVAEIMTQVEEFYYYRTVVVATSGDGDVLVLDKLGEWILHVFHGECLEPTQHWRKQTLVPHTFSPTL